MKIGKIIACLIILQIILTFSTEYLLLYNDLYYDFFNQLAYDRVSEIIELGKKWKWLSYFLIPIFLLIKLFSVGICLSVGGLVVGVENGFKRFFTVGLYAEFIFLLPVVFKIIWFVFFDNDYTLKELQYFSPLSVFSFFRIDELDPWIVYPLQLLNVFEVLYWFFLAYMLKDILGKKFIDCLGFVAATYGIGLSIWVVLIMFLTVTIS